MALDAFERAVLEGLASPVQEMTAQDWDDLYAEIERVHPERDSRETPDERRP